MISCSIDQTTAGVTGADRGEGGKFVVVPVDFKGTVPNGYFTVRTRTSLVAYFARGIIRNGDVAGAAKSLETTRFYPLAKRNDPPKTTVVLSSGKNFDQIPPQGFEYSERVAAVVNYISEGEDGAFLRSLLRSLGIEAGQRFEPDARMRRILTEASEVAWAMDQVAPRLPDVVHYPGTQWEFVMLLDLSLKQEYWRDLKARINYLFQGTRDEREGHR